MGVKGSSRVWLGGLAMSAAIMLASGTVFAQSLVANPADIEGVLNTLEAASATERPSVFTTDEGFLRFLSAPREGVFQVREEGAKSTDPYGAAQTFLEDHKGAFGIVSNQSRLVPYRVQELSNGQVVRLQQEYSGIPVFGAQTVVRQNSTGQVLHVLSDVLRDTRSLDRGDISLQPSIGISEAVIALRHAVAEKEPNIGAPQLQSALEPELVIFSPAVMGQAGPERLAYRAQVMAVSPIYVRAEGFVDAHTGVVIWHYSMLDRAIEREIFDFNESFVAPFFPTRRENDPPSGIVDVDTTFDFLGDTYDFYLNELGWRSYDNEDSPLVANVRLPVQNAFLDTSTNESFYGTGWATDDVVGHEVTHALTEATSGLIYFGFSGAINESMSDIFGEFIDLGNGAGNDIEEVRWLVGEDIPEFSRQRQVVPEGEFDPEDLPDSLPPGIRSMQDPTIFGDPDRLSSDLLADVNSFFDNGGVHINSGIGNKLAYLLTDGDTFNGQTVEGMGISMVAQLFFGAQLILTPSADYEDLYFALMATAEDMGLSAGEMDNIQAATDAVEIAPEIPERTTVSAFRATPTEDIDGNAVVLLSWEIPSSDFLQSVTLVRSTTGFTTDPLGARVLAEGRIDEFLDVDVQRGVRYFYTLVAQLVGNPVPQFFFASATAGDVPIDAPVEAFTPGRRPGSSANPIDLSFSQLLYSPTGAPEGPINAPARGQDLRNYVATFTPEVFSLPVPRQDSAGGATQIFFDENLGLLLVASGGRTFPFFGVPLSTMFLSPKGYLSPNPVDSASLANVPTLANHFEIPRISFLFSNLSFASGGEAWVRDLDDRLVVTFENVPEFDLDNLFFTPNTVQVELFYSGHIQITYGSLSINSGIVGLSDGRGVPVDPSERYPILRPGATSIDLSALPAIPDRLTFTPNGFESITAGELLEASVAVASAQPGEATLLGSWTRAGQAPFADNGNGTGSIRWQSAVDDSGFVTFRVEARQGDERAFQDLRVSVGEVVQLPTARNLALSTGSPFEIPTESRLVSTNRPLFAEYEFVQPGREVGEGEGPSIVLWFKNGESVPSLNNSRQVPASFTRGGEQWYFRLTPINEDFVVGESLVSPQVQITGGPQLQSVSPAFGELVGGTKVLVRGEDLDGAIEVLFGGVKAPSLRGLDRNTVEVTTPLHPKGPVDVVVRTARGLGRLPNGFTYITSAADFVSEDVNGDGKVNAQDIQIVVQAILAFDQVKEGHAPDVNSDGRVNAADLQRVINAALRR